jgi:hypothetical protein
VQESAATVVQGIAAVDTLADGAVGERWEFERFCYCLGSW